MPPTPLPRRRRRSSPPRWLALLATALVALSVLSATPASAATSASAATATTAQPLSRAVAASGIRPAADLSLFRAGNIISDAVFTDAGTMTADQIQAFLQSKGWTCQSGYTCLKDFRISSVDRPADRYCNGYSGVPNERASSILARVAQSCGINPQVLVVMPQKEQGLVTHTWPSQWRYDAALDQGCPDDAPCDPSFVGFFHQIYGAARQMKIYLEGRYFQWYAPGNTWSILYNPDRSCGSSPVYIENAATAALYYYTPYQPNRAALAAGYGEGDYCSAYGNRNFFNYFTDWFGSTQTLRSALVQVAGDPAVYLLSGGGRYHVRTPSDLAAFSSVLGGVVRVSPAELQRYPAWGEISRYIHDPRTGTLYLLEADGTRHRFRTAASVASFGYAFDSYVNLDSALTDRFAVGPEVGSVFTIDRGGQVFVNDGGARRYVPTIPTLTALLGQDNTYVATMDGTAAAKLSEGPLYLFAGTLVQVPGTPAVYLSSSGHTLIHTPSLALAAEYGAGSDVFLVSAADLARFTIAPTTLTPLLICGATTYVADGGQLTAVGGDARGMFVPTALSDADCAGFPKSGMSTAVPFFPQSSNGQVYHAANGTLRYIWEPAELGALAGGGPIRLPHWSEGTLQTFPAARPALSDGTAVQFAGDGRVFRWDGQALRHVSTFQTLLNLYGGRVPPILPLPTSSASAFAYGPPV